MDLSMRVKMSAYYSVVASVLFALGATSGGWARYHDELIQKTYLSLTDSGNLPFANYTHCRLTNLTYDFRCDNFTRGHFTDCTKECREFVRFKMPFTVYYGYWDLIGESIYGYEYNTTVILSAGFRVPASRSKGWSLFHVYSSDSPRFESTTTTAPGKWWPFWNRNSSDSPRFDTTTTTTPGKWWPFWNRNSSDSPRFDSTITPAPGKGWPFLDRNSSRNPDIEKQNEIEIPSSTNNVTENTDYGWWTNFLDFLKKHGIYGYISAKPHQSVSLNLQNSQNHIVILN